MKKTLLIVAVLSAVVLLSCSRTSLKQDETLVCFDTYTVIGAYLDDAEFARLRDTAFGLLAEYDALYDIYHDRGEPNLKTVNDNAGVAPVAVDERIIDLLEFGIDMYGRTGGKLNIAMGSVTSIWHDIRESGAPTLPGRKELENAAVHCDITKIVIDRENSTVYLDDPLMRLDVGAVAKGYAAEEVCRVLKETVAKDFILNAGGNVCACGEKPDGKWRVGIRDPDDPSGLVKTVELSDAALVTSGGYERFFEVDGVRYSHIIDPDTLMPADRYASVSVVGSSSAICDALSTAAFLSDPDGLTELCSAFPGTAFIVLDNDGECLEYPQK